MYLWIKAAHVIFVIAFMAGMLILPRYRIHQLSSRPGEPLFETMKSASAKLQKIILVPSIILVWVLGIAMILVNPQIMSGGWLHAKIVLVLLLSGMHGYMTALGKKIDRNETSLNISMLKLLNELPFILMIAIVILVVVKPF